MVAVRKKEDPWNSIISGGITSSLLAFRGGGKAMVKSGAFGMVALAVIEGLVIFMQKGIGRFMLQQEKNAGGMPGGPPGRPQDTLAPPTSGFGSW